MAHLNRVQRTCQTNMAFVCGGLILLHACQPDPVRPLPSVPDSVVSAAPADSQHPVQAGRDSKVRNSAETQIGNSVDVPKIVGRRIDGPPLQAARLDITKNSGEERFTLRTIKPTLVETEIPATVKLELMASAPWKINLDYPVHVRVHGPNGVRVTKQEQDKSDAVKIDQKHIVYDVNFVSEDSGEVHFSGLMKFAICQEDSCVPVSHPFMFDITIPERG